MMKFVKLFFINLISLVLISEIFLFCYYSFKDKSFVSAPELYKSYFQFDSLDSEKCSWGDSVGPHPYLSIYYPKKETCETFSRNNYGFRGNDIPLEYDSNFYTLLITGASVAEQIGNKNLNSNENYLQNYLNSHWISPNKKPFRVISSAVAAAHQPVTLIEAVLFSSLADQVMSVEGYNEHFGINGNSLIEQPVQAWIDSQSIASSPFTFYVLKSALKQARFIQDSWLKYSLLYYTFLSHTATYLKSRINSDTALPFPNTPADWTPEKRQDFYLKKYASYVQMAARLVLAQKKHYTLFIQPAPMFYKSLTPDEVKAIGDNSSQARYPLVIDMLKNLNSNSIHIESLEKVFSAENQTLYVDHIHTNFTGVKILSESIAERLARRYGWKTK